MKIEDIRRKNLRYLCDQIGRKIVANRLGYTEKYVGVLLSEGKKRTNIGPNVVAKIEAEFSEFGSTGWMSIPQWPDDPREMAKREIDQLDPAKVADVVKMLKSLNQD